MDYTLLFKRLLPEVLLTFTALSILGLDLGVWLRLPVSLRKTIAALELTLGCLLVWSWSSATGEAGHFYNGVWVMDPSIVYIKKVLLGLVIGTAWLTRETEFTQHVGEYFALLLLSTAGMFLLVSTENLLLAFVSLELLSLSLYLMTAFAKDDPKSSEAGLKYFLFGGLAAAVLLYGVSILYGISGQIQLTDMAVKLASKPMEPALMMGMIFVAAGLGFKVAAVPFHLWAPDTYHGAPTPTAAFIASGSKVASFYLLAKIVLVGLGASAGSGAWHAFGPGWVPLLAILAAASVVIGNLTAIVQTGLKRLLAYSAVAHAGYALVGLVANRSEGGQALLYYVITYAVTSLGVFGIVAVVERSTGSDTIDSLAGLSRRSPYIAWCLAVFLLSLAGIPPLAGFFGKFYLFTAALNAKDHPLGLVWLVGLALTMSCVALYYYLLVLKRVFVSDPVAGQKAIQVTWATRLLLGICAVAIVVWGCYPQLVLRHFPIPPLLGK